MENLKVVLEKNSGGLISCSGDFILQNLILRTRLCGTEFIAQHSCVFDFDLTEICQTEMICPPKNGPIAL